MKEGDGEAGFAYMKKMLYLCSPKKNSRYDRSNDYCNREDDYERAHINDSIASWPDAGFIVRDAGE